MNYIDIFVKIGAVLAAIGGVLISEPASDATLYGKLALAIGGVMIAWGATNQAKDLSAAMRAPVQVISATPDARSEIAAAETAKRPVPTPEEQAIIDKFRA